MSEHVLHVRKRREKSHDTIFWYGTTEPQTLRDSEYRIPRPQRNLRWRERLVEWSVERGSSSCWSPTLRCRDARTKWARADQLTVCELFTLVRKWRERYPHQSPHSDHETTQERRHSLRCVAKTTQQTKNTSPHPWGSADRFDARTSAMWAPTTTTIL